MGSGAGIGEGMGFGRFVGPGVGTMDGLADSVGTREGDHDAYGTLVEGWNWICSSSVMSFDPVSLSSPADCMSRMRRAC